MEAETITLTKDELKDVISEATLKATSKVIAHFQNVLAPKEETIKVSRAYRVKEVAKLLNMSESTVMRNYNCTDKELIKKNGRCLLVRNRKKLFLGSSVKAEYERLNGK